MYCKIIDISNDKVKLYCDSGIILDVASNKNTNYDLENAKQYGIIKIINGEFDTKACKYKINIDYNTINGYRYLKNLKDEKSQKINTKAKLLGLENTHRVSDDGTLIIGDYNRALQRNLQAETVRFIGSNPLINSNNNVKPNIICQRAIIENHCVVSNLLIQAFDKINVIAYEYVLSHKLMDKYTVDEIFTIFKFIMTPGLSGASIKLEDNYYMQKILIDTTKIKEEQKEIIDKTLKLIKDALLHYKKDDLDYVISIKLATLHTAISIHESYNFSSKQLSTAIDALNFDLSQYESSMQYNNRVRYRRLMKDYKNVNN